MLTKEEARTAMNTLVSSGLVPLYVIYHQNKYGKPSAKRIYLKSHVSYEVLGSLLDKEAKVYSKGDVFTGWFLYPTEEQAGELAPTIGLPAR